MNIFKEYYDKGFIYEISCTEKPIKELCGIVEYKWICNPFSDEKAVFERHYENGWRLKEIQQNFDFHRYLAHRIEYQEAEPHYTKLQFKD